MFDKGSSDTVVIITSSGRRRSCLYGVASSLSLPHLELDAILVDPANGSGHLSSL